MLKIIIENTDDNIVLSKQQSIDLELKLNVTYYGKEWKYIGDYLYDYGTGKHSDNFEFIVSLEQFSFLQLLMTKNGWTNCVNLK